MTTTRNLRTHRGELVIVALLLAVGIWLLSGHATVNVIGETVPGPLFMPTLVGVASLGLAAALALDIFLNPRRAPFGSADPSPVTVSPDMLADFGGLDKDHLDEEVGPRAAAGETGSAGTAGGEEGERTDWKTVSLVFLAFVAAIALLNVAGWVIASSLLFFALAQILGESPWGRDLAVSFIIGSVTYLVFGVALGLSLPAGIVGGI